MLARSFATLAIATLLSTSVHAQATESARPGPPDIETVGTAQRRVAPDRANVHLFVETRAASAAAAAAANNRAVQAVMDTLRRIALDSGVTTASFHVGPHYEPVPDRGEPRRSGYSARTVLRVRLGRIENVGRVIDAALGKGASGVENVWFESSTAEQARREALADAALAARRDAEALAAALGGTLGPLLSTSTAGASDPRRMNVAMGEITGAMMRTMVNPAEIVIAAGVITRWQFIPR